MSKSAQEKAIGFIENEKQFHLGFLPTEQSHPLTSCMDKTFSESTVGGVSLLQKVDRGVLAMAKKVFASENYSKLVSCGENIIRNGGRIIFSGCGATGRLSILLECMWKDLCASDPFFGQFSGQVESIMTGGDFALVKSVEFFEDYQSFGRRQARDMHISSKDMLVAITEGGETSSVLGTLFEALDCGAEAFLLFNNPADLLAEKLERSAKAIRDPRVNVLDLFCGPMALAGSTRMQATTSEQLIAGAALEDIAYALIGRERKDHAAEFECLLDSLEKTAAVNAIAEFIDFEAEIYRKKGFMTYFADDFMLDIFTDTTERSPTFMLPPFRKNDDVVSPQPWTLVKNPLFSTAEVWEKAMHRPLRCLDWQSGDYAAMGAADNIKSKPPQINSSELLKFPIGYENPTERTINGHDAAVLITVGTKADDDNIFSAFRKISSGFAEKRHLAIGGRNDADFMIPFDAGNSPMRLMEHLAVKLVLNTASTGIMTVAGRVSGNWMSFVDVTNKKLLDRGIRLISEIGKLDYRSSCIKLFEAIEFLEKNRISGTEKVSAVQHVLASLADKKQ